MNSLRPLPFALRAATCGWRLAPREWTSPLLPLIFSVFLTLPSTSQEQDFLPIDHKGEPPSSHVAYIPNKGQMTTLQGGLMPDILYHSIQSNPQLFFSNKNEIFFSVGARDTSLATPDTIFRVGMQFVGNAVNAQCIPNSYNESSDYYNFILGHCPDGIFGIHSYRRIVYPDVYPGIDFHAYSNPWGPKFYLVIAPGSDPATIKLKFQGQDSLLLDILGNLKAYIEESSIILPKGLCYQQIGNATELVSAALNYELNESTGTVGFEFETYNPAYPLIVDISASLGPQGGDPGPVPEWCTFYGHTEQDFPEDAVVLPNGGLMVCGTTYSPSFPLFSEQADFFDGSREAYYSEFDPEYKRIYTTFFGGNAADGAQSMALTTDGNSVYLFGRSTSTNLPVLEYNGGFYDNTPGGPTGRDCYVARFSRTSNPIGLPEWTTYFGDGITTCNCLRVDTEDNIHLVGTTDPFDDPGFELTCDGTDGTFPSCNPAGSADFFQAQINNGSDAFYAKFNSDLQLVHSTFFGGGGTEQGRDMVIDNSNQRVYIVGNTTSRRLAYTNCQPTSSGGFPLCNLPGSYFQSNLNGTNTAGLNDGFIACFGFDGALLWSTYVGSTSDEIGFTVGINFSGEVYMAGQTDAVAYATAACQPPSSAAGFLNCASGTQVQLPPTASPVQGYIVKFNSSQALDWATLIKGTVTSFMPDEQGNIVISLTTSAGSGGTAPIPVLQIPNHYYQPTHADAPSPGGDAMVLKFNPSDELVYGTYFGGLGADYAVKVLPYVGGRLYLVGFSYSSDEFPFHCPTAPDPYCYLSYATQSPKTGEVFYAQLQNALTIGLDEEAQTLDADEVVIYPNPSAGNISVNFGSAWSSHGQPSVHIYDPSGRLVRTITSTEAATGTLTVDLLDLADGLYVVHLRSKDSELARIISFILQ